MIKLLLNINCRIFHTWVCVRLGIPRPVQNFPIAVSFKYESKTDRVTAEPRQSRVFVVCKRRRS